MPNNDMRTTIRAGKGDRILVEREWKLGEYRWELSQRLVFDSVREAFAKIPAWFQNASLTEENTNA